MPLSFALKPLSCLIYLLYILIRYAVRQGGSFILMPLTDPVLPSARLQLMNIPYQLVHYSIYDGAKRVLMGPAADSQGADDTLPVQLLAGGLAGGLAAAVTTPLDVVKTRLQTEGVHSKMRYGNGALVRNG